MRTQIMPALGLALALLAGCAEAAPGDRGSMPANGSIGALGASNVVSSAAETLDFVLENEEHGDQRFAEDGTLLATYSYALPVLRVITGDGQVLDSYATAAEKAELDAAAAFNDSFASWVADSNFPGILSWAAEDYAYYAENQLDWQGYYNEEFTYTSWRTDRLVSIAGKYYSYTGGAHPNTVFLGWNFDLQTGRFLHPAALGADSGEFQAAVTQEILRQADDRAAKEGFDEPTALYWKNYQDIAAQWIDYAVTFSDMGMTVTFSAYELAPYAAGPQVFALDWDFLRPWLSEDGKLLLNLPEDTETAAK